MKGYTKMEYKLKDLLRIIDEKIIIEGIIVETRNGFIGKTNIY